MNNTSIEWCRTYAADGSFEEGFSVNPVRFRPFGSQRLVTMCQKVSPGCKNCYAETITRRFWPKDADRSFPGYTAAGVASGEFVLDEKTLLSVLKRRKPARVFWGDMTDLFQDCVTNEMLDRCFAVCALTPHLTHMFLTKRPERMLEYFSHKVREGLIGFQISQMHLARTGIPVSEWSGLPMPNVILMTSAENQEQADVRIPLLLRMPAAVRGVSLEPLLGLIDLTQIPRPFEFHQSPYGWMSWLSRQLHWVIVGGESGTGQGIRMMEVGWAQALRDQCASSGIAFFFKQWGAFLPDRQNPLMKGIAPATGGIKMGKHDAGRLLDGREHNAMPEVRDGRA
jgi:protein gp37